MTRLISPFVVMFVSVNIARAAEEIFVDVGVHPSAHARAVLSADGSTAATIGHDRDVRIWNLNTGKPLWSFWLPPGIDGLYNTRAACLAPDGKLLAMPIAAKKSDLRGHVALIPLTGSERGTYRTIGDNRSAVKDFAFSPDGAHIVLASYDSPITIWDATTAKQVCSIEHERGRYANGFGWTPDGKKITIAMIWAEPAPQKNDTISTFDAATGELVGEFVANQKGGESIGLPRWSPDGKTLALNRFNLKLVTADGVSRRILGSFVRNDGTGTPAVTAFDLRGRFLVLWHHETCYLVRDEISDVEIAQFPHLAGGAADLMFTERGDRFIIVGSEEMVVYDVKPAVPARPRPTGRYIRFANSPPRILGWSEGMTLAWSSTGEQGDEKTEYEGAVNFGEMTSTKPDPRQVVRERIEWDGVKLNCVRDSDSASISFKGKTVPLDFEKEDFQNEIHSFTLAGPGHALLATHRGIQGFNTLTGKRTAYYQKSAICVSPTLNGSYFAMSSTEGPCAFIYKVENFTPLLTVFPLKDQWAAWLRDGSWASSPGAEKFAGTLSKAEPGKLRTFVPLDPMKRNPDKIKKALSP